MNKLRRFGLSLLISLMVQGCTQVPFTLSPKNAPNKPNLALANLTEDSVKLAKRLEKSGKYAEAANEYRVLASRLPAPSKQAYQLAAVEAYLDGKAITEAKSLLTEIDVSRSIGLQHQIEFSQIHLLIAEKRLDEADARLSQMGAVSLPVKLRIKYYELRAQLQEARGNTLGAVQELAQLDGLLDANMADLQEAHEYIWRILSALPPETLNNANMGNSNFLPGWFALASLARNTPPQGLQSALLDWQNRYPYHPASRNILPNLIQANNSPSLKTMAQQQEPISTKPQQVALLLPLSGSFKAQAEAVKEGFMAAWYADNLTLPRPEVKFYDANSSNIVQTYQQVITAGANFVVGPLEKDTVNVLVNNQSYLPVPTIALNSLESSPNRVNFYQFALLPEDEARDAAIRARNEGLSMAAAFVPEGDWGARVLKAFQQEWVKRGGKLQIVRNYSQQNFENTIKQAMLTAQVDMVFLAASPPFARQIRPLLRNFGNGNLPIYSTSHVYTGTVDLQNDRELEGIRFGDMPWVLAPDEAGRQLQNSIQQSSPENLTQFKRLYAFGIDAYNLLLQLASLKAQSSMQLKAYTGALSLDGNGIVHRQMSWAQFANGQPVLLDGFSRP
ncbi:MAG: hypothetical protein RIS84_555 [Pseudomonadota bacterium]|jgi:hypothetical protein